MKRLFYLIAIVGFIITSCAETENPKPNEEKTYSFSIGAERETDNTDETRVEMIDGLMHWSVGENVVMSSYGRMMPSFYAGFAVDKLLMTGTHTQPTRNTTFRGELTETQIKQLDPNSLYHHISYYPYSASSVMPSFSGNGAPVIIFSINEGVTLTKNVLPMEYMFMYAYTQGGPMTWLDENGEQQWDEKKTLKYKHALSYIRLKLDINLMSLPVTKIEIEPIGITNTMSFTGRVYVDINTDNITGNTIDRKLAVNIPEGFNVGDEIYIRVIPGTSIGSNFNFTFTFANGLEYTKQVRNLNASLEAGKIYNMSFKLPYIVDFANRERYFNQPSLGNGLLPNPFDYGGHTYIGNGIWGRTFSIAMGWLIATQNTLATPVLDISGKTEVPVLVRVYGQTEGGGPSFTPGDGPPYYVNTAPNDITTYDYSTEGARVTGTLIEMVPVPLILTPTNSRIGISFESRADPSRRYITNLELDKIEVTPQ